MAGRRLRGHRALAIAIAATLVVLTGLATPASAADKSVEKVRFHGSESCDTGLLIWQTSGTNQLEITATSNDGQAFLADQHLDLVWNHNLRGQRFTVTMNIRYVETSMTLLSADDPRLEGVAYVGPVYEFEAYQMTSVTVRTSDGTIVPEYTESDVRTDFVDVYDTLGDSTPGAELITGESSGPFPAFFDASGCEVAAAAAQV